MFPERRFGVRGSLCRSHVGQTMSRRAEVEFVAVEKSPVSFVPETAFKIVGETLHGLLDVRGVEDTTRREVPSPNQVITRLSVHFRRG